MLIRHRVTRNLLEMVLGGLRGKGLIWAVKTLSILGLVLNWGILWVLKGVWIHWERLNKRWHDRRPVPRIPSGPLLSFKSIILPFVGVGRRINIGVVDVIRNIVSLILSSLSLFWLPWDHKCRVYVCDFKIICCGLQRALTKIVILKRLLHRKVLIKWDLIFVHDIQTISLMECLPRRVL